MRLSKILAAVTLSAAVALLVVACTGQAGSPVSPGKAGVIAANDEKNPEVCNNGVDDDGDKAVDCEDSECATDPACTKTEGTPCSPGYWKNHLDQFNAVCGSVSGWTCESLFYAISCKGSQPGCTGANRQAAAAALNEISGCTE